MKQTIDRRSNKLLTAFFVFAFLLFARPASATDLVVQEMGPAGTYASITAAVTAAVDGDRIIVNNRAGGVPWVENITITKTLTFISAAADTFFHVQGSWSIQMSTPGKKVTIIGMKNFNGAISAGANAPAGAPTQLRVLGSYIVGTLNYISIVGDNYDVTVSGCILDGSINIRSGLITGNSVGGSIQVGNEATAPASPTMVYVVGNKLTAALYDLHRILYYNAYRNFYIANNFVAVYRGLASPNAYAAGIYIGVLPAGANTILNNTVQLNVPSNGSPYYEAGIMIQATYGTAGLDVRNNVAYVPSNTIPVNVVYGIYSTTVPNNTSYFSYNYVDVNIPAANRLANIFDDGTNTLTINIASQNASGQPLDMSSALVGINGGDPNAIYTDLDLTANDAGAYGGSFTLNNFFFTHASNFAGGKNRIYFVNAPRTIIPGNNINVNGDGYDR